MAPFEQLSTWLMLSASPHAQCEGSLSSCHPSAHTQYIPEGLVVVAESRILAG